MKTKILISILLPMKEMNKKFEQFKDNLKLNEESDVVSNVLVINQTFAEETEMDLFLCEICHKEFHYDEGMECNYA